MSNSQLGKRALAWLFSALACAGCDTVSRTLGPNTCDRSDEANPPAKYTQGSVEDGTYMSSPWDEELLYFPGGMQYEIEHKLGRVPTLVQFYLSFNRKGLDGGVFAQSAGNQAELTAINDETLIVKNDTCAEYWLLVVASTGDVSSDE